MKTQVSSVSGCRPILQLVLLILFFYTGASYVLGSEVKITVYQPVIDLNNALRPATSAEIRAFANQEVKAEEIIRKNEKWFFLIITNRLQNDHLRNWFLYLADRADYIDCYIEQHDSISVLKAGNLYGSFLKHLSTPHQINRIPLDLSPGEKVRILIHYRGIRGYEIVTNVQLRRNEKFSTWNFVKKKQLIGIWLGFLLTMILINLVMAVATKDRPFLFHGFYMVGVFFFMLDNNQILHNFPLLKIFPIAKNIVNYLSLSIIGIGYLLFIRTFLELRQLLPRWDRIFRYLIWGQVILFFGAFIYFGITWNEAFCDQLFAGVLLVQYLFIIFPFLLVLSKEQTPIRWFIIGGTSFLFVTIVVEAFLVVIKQPFFQPLLYIGIIAEATIFTYGLGYRYLYFRNEKERAGRLQELNDFKNRFFSNITHEFRTPLTVILGMASQLAEQPGVKPKVKVGVIERQGEKLLSLINQILDLAKAEEGQMQLKCIQDDIIPYLGFLVNAFETYAEEKQIDLVYYHEQPSVVMDYDPVRLENIITNLLSNALKFTPDKGKVSVGVRRLEDDSLEIKVMDTGIGLKADELPHIFDRFYQTESSAEDARLKGAGSGIGLALTKELVHLLNGKINVESHYGKGSVFTILLPITNQAPVETNKPEFSIFSPENKKVEEQEVGALYREDLPLALIVDDNRDILIYLRLFLRNEFRIIEASNGAEALEVARQQIPDIIITDVVMPEMDGLELCNRLKSDEWLCHVPVIMLTAKATINDRIAGFKHGADAYLAKPFNKEELNIVLQKSMNLRDLLRGYYQRAALYENETPLKNAAEEQFKKRLINAISDNLDNYDFKAPDLARILGDSESTANKKIQSVTGMSIKQYINHYRLMRAKELVTYSDLSMKEIAYAIGFKDPSYFSRQFKKKFGHSPSEEMES